MVRTKREYEGGLAAWHAAAMIAFMPFTGKQLSPAAINPFGPNERSDTLAKTEQWVQQQMWRAWVKAKFREAGKEV